MFFGIKVSLFNLLNFKSDPNEKTFDPSINNNEILKGFTQKEHRLLSLEIFNSSIVVSASIS
jgi:hypothetical protein